MKSQYTGIHKQHDSEMQLFVYNDVDLDEYEDFADFMNVRINELLIKHNLILSSQKQTDNLTIELRPIFNDFYRKYAMICAPDGGMQ